MCVYTCVVEISAWPRMVCTVRRSAPFSTMCVAHECRSMCGEAFLPDAAEAARTICQTRCRVSLRAARAINSSGELFVPAAFDIVNTGRASARYFVSASCADRPSGTSRFQLQVFQLRAGHLRHAQRSRVENLQDGVVANCQSCGELGRFAACAPRGWR